MLVVAKVRRTSEPIPVVIGLCVFATSLDRALNDDDAITANFQSFQSELDPETISFDSWRRRSGEKWGHAAEDECFV